jgi:hypothetical protein
MKRQTLKTKPGTDIGRSNKKIRRRDDGVDSRRRTKSAKGRASTVRTNRGKALWGSERNHWLEEEEVEHFGESWSVGRPFVACKAFIQSWSSLMLMFQNFPEVSKSQNLIPLTGWTIFVNEYLLGSAERSIWISQYIIDKVSHMNNNNFKSQFKISYIIYAELYTEFWKLVLFRMGQRCGRRWLRYYECMAHFNFSFIDLK